MKKNSFRNYQTYRHLSYFYRRLDQLSTNDGRNEAGKWVKGDGNAINRATVISRVLIQKRVLACSDKTLRQHVDNNQKDDGVLIAADAGQNEHGNAGAQEDWWRFKKRFNFST